MHKTGNEMEPYSTHQDPFPENDFFAALMYPTPTKLIFFFCSFVLIIFGIPGFYCIIWFEKYGNDNKRTLLNMFVSLYCWAVTEFVIFVQIPETIRLSFGPLPAFVCGLHAYFRASIVTVMLLYKNASILTRYIFIFWLKNPAAFDDDFWCLFIFIWVHIFSLLFRGTEHFISANMSITYFICTGKEPYITGQPKFSGIIELFTIVLHIFVYTRIYFYKRDGKEGRNMATNKKLTVKDVETR